MSYRRQLESAVRATRILSTTRYSWFGRRSPELSARMRAGLTPETARRYLAHTLTWELYAHFYCSGIAVPAGTDRVTSGGRSAAHAEALSSVNHGKGFWEPGWTLRGREGDRYLVEQEGLSVLVSDAEIEPKAGGRRVGSVVAVAHPKELLVASPGFYLALGDRPLTADPALQLRLYWHLSAPGAVAFVEQCTRWLNRAGVAFRLKVLNDPESFERCDAGVLYLLRADYSAVEKLLRAVLGALEGYLHRAVPALTKPLAPGVGLAESPAAGESFGLHRCRCVAEGLVAAWSQGLATTEERLEQVEATLLEHRIQPDRPFLGPESERDYPLPKITGKLRKPVAQKPSAIERTPERWLGASIDIGRALAQRAFWHRGQCNWLGSMPSAPSDPDPEEPATSALGPGLYAGTAGIALFLAELSRHSKDDLLVRTARGAARQALTQARRIGPPAVGFYIGRPGIGWSVVRVGRLTGDESLVRRGLRLASGGWKEAPATVEVDLLSGLAGAVVALLALHREVGKARLVVRASRLADQLVNRAELSGATLSWRSPMAADRRNLTGFSHGTAGIAFALFELHAETGEARYREAAMAAFEYERRWYSHDERNWPDFRSVPRRARVDRDHLSFPATWCHGAPGIAISRLRAFQRSGDPMLRDEANVALDTTHGMVRGWLDSATGDYSLCHGLAGNAEILHYGYRVLGAERKRDVELVREVAARGLALYGEREGSWPCGTGSGHSPGLMIGTAGIGLFYLRLHDPSIRSILLPAS